MNESPITRPSLLARIRDASDRLAWGEFVDLYAPLIHGFARKHGLQDADAADVTQDVLRSIARKADDFVYDTRKGSFRGYLFTVVRNRLRDFFDAARRRKPGKGGTTAVQFLLELPDDGANLEAEWDREHERRLLASAMNAVRPKFETSTWEAFRRTAVEDRPACEVAAELGMTIAAVYIAKSRVMARLKEQVRDWLGEEVQ